MKIGHILRGECPNCGTRPRISSAWKCIQRRYIAGCRGCGARLESELGGVQYVSLVLYMHLALTIVALPLVLGLAGGLWFMAAGAALVFLLLAMPPAMMLHARNLRIER